MTLRLNFDYSTHTLLKICLEHHLLLHHHISRLSKNRNIEIINEEEISYYFRVGIDFFLLKLISHNNNISFVLTIAGTSNIESHLNNFFYLTNNVKAVEYFNSLPSRVLLRINLFINKYLIYLEKNKSHDCNLESDNKESNENQEKHGYKLNNINKTSNIDNINDEKVEKAYLDDLKNDINGEIEPIQETDEEDFEMNDETLIGINENLDTINQDFEDELDKSIEYELENINFQYSQSDKFFSLVDVSTKFDLIINCYSRGYIISNHFGPHFFKQSSNFSSSNIYFNLYKRIGFGIPVLLSDPKKISNFDEFKEKYDRITTIYNHPEDIICKSTLKKLIIHFNKLLMKKFRNRKKAFFYSHYLYNYYKTICDSVELQYNENIFDTSFLPSSSSTSTNSTISSTSSSSSSSSTSNGIIVSKARESAIDQSNPFGFPKNSKRARLYAKISPVVTTIINSNLIQNSKTLTNKVIDKTRRSHEKIKRIIHLINDKLEISDFYWGYDEDEIDIKEGEDEESYEYPPEIICEEELTDEKIKDYVSLYSNHKDISEIKELKKLNKLYWDKIESKMDEMEENFI